MPTPTIEYRTVDKSEWGPGPWASEPDKRQWADPVTGLPCLIVRGPMGALCGYVGVDPSHPAHGMSYYASRYGDDGEEASLAPVEAAVNSLQAHGGLTYADGCGHDDNPAEGICHIPAAGEPDHVWWFGFDCAHYGDQCPGAHSDSLSACGSYRELAYVEAEVAALAAQLKAITAASERSEEASPRQVVQPIRDEP